MFKYKQKNKESGFTVIEAIVATLVFSILMIASAGIFFRAIDLQRRAFAAQKIQENILFVMEAMARDIRVSQICPTSSVCDSDTLSINHPIRGDLIFSLDTGRGVIVKTENAINVDMTSSEVTFSRFQFNVSGAGPDCRDPKITIISSLRNTFGRPITIDLQTTITTRDSREEFLFPPATCP